MKAKAEDIVVAASIATLGVVTAITWGLKAAERLIPRGGRVPS